MLIAAGAAALILFLAIGKKKGSKSEINDYANEEIVTGDSYGSVELGELYEAGKLTGYEGVTIEKNESGGLMLSGKVSDINAGKFTVSGVFDFDRKPVGRISLDALADYETTANAFVYLDGKEEAAADYALRHCISEDEIPEDFENFTEPDDGQGWDTRGDVTKLVLDQNITGKHKVSFSFKVSGKSDDEEVQILVRSIEFAESTIPVLYFDIDESQGTIKDKNLSADKSAECTGKLNVLIPEGFVSEYTGEGLSDITGLELKYVRGRGNSTWTGAEKKPYKFKLEEGYDFFGMGKNKSWALITNAFDDSQLRNRLTYWLGGGLGLAYTPQCVTVEVVFNDRYYGTYTLSETVEIGEGRVEIDELTDEDVREPEITGGYIVSSFSIADDEEEAKFRTENGMSFMNDTPDGIEEGTPEQIDYIRNYIQQTDDAIFGDGFKDKNGKSYTEYMDVASMIDYWWVQIFSVNPDGFVASSTFLYKEREGKLYWGPLWDFDYAWGKRNFGDNDIPVEKFEQTDISVLSQYAWHHRLMDDPEYMATLKEHWKIMDKKLHEITKEGRILDRYYDEIKTAARYNYERWGHKAEDLTFDEEVAYLRDWINRRRAWMNDNFDELDNIVVTATFMVDDEEYSQINVSNGNILFELPEEPEKEDRVFIGWFTDQDEEIDCETIIENDVAVYAKFISKEEAIPAEAIYFAEYNPGRNNFVQEYMPEMIIYPLDAQDKSVTWTSSDESLASVDKNGNVTIKDCGTVTITATLSNGVTNSYTLTSFDTEKDNIDITVKDVALASDAINVKVSETAQIKVISDPASAILTCSYEVEDESIATVDNYGVVVGKKAGTTTVKVSEFQSEKEFTCTITVSE